MPYYANMKKSSIQKIAFLASLFLTAITSQAAYTVAVFETANPSNVRHFEFTSAGTNVSNQLIANIDAPAPLGDCSFWVGQDQAQVPGVSATQPVASIMGGTSCSGTSFSFTIYAGGTDANYKPENFKCIDTAEYTYGMACWPNQLTHNCSGGASSAANHIFTKNGNVWTYQFPVNDPASTFKLLKSADGANWVWDAGQLGHSLSGTQLTAGAGVSIANNGQGDISLNLTGLQQGDYVTLTLQKDGAVYALSAEYMAKPILENTSQVCGVNPVVSCKVKNYNPAVYTYTYIVNGGTETPLASDVVEVLYPTRFTEYSIVVVAYKDGSRVTSDVLEVLVPARVAEPVLVANTAACGAEIGFTIANYYGYGAGVTFDIPAGYVQNGNAISLATSPVNGTTYTLSITANDGCTTAVSAPESQTYMAEPAQPTVQASSVCNALAFEVVQPEATHRYQWLIDNAPVLPADNVYTITSGTHGVLHTATVTVFAPNGCSAEGIQTGTFYATPQKPILQVEEGCDKDVVFKLTNYDATAKYKWTISTSTGITQTVEPQNGTDQYQVAAPIEGTTYTMQVTAWRDMPNGNQCSVTSDAVQQQCKLKPAAPIVAQPVYQVCQQEGTKLWADLVRVSSGCTLVWYDMNGNELLVSSDAFSFDMNIPSDLVQYQVAQKSAYGCVSDMVTVGMRVEEKPTAFAGPDMEICSAATGVRLAEGEVENLNMDYSWSPASYLEDSRVASPTLTHLNVNPDDEIEFTLTVANKNLPSCRSTDNVKVKVLALPQITIQETTTGIIDVCDGTAAGVTLVPESGIIYNWIDPDGVLASKMSTSAITNPIVADATISVTATRRTANTECVSQPTTIQFKKVDLPVFSASGGKGDQLSVCDGKTIQLGEQGNNQTEYRWESIPAGRLDSNIPNPYITVTEDVTYKVTATLKQEPRCSTTSTVYVERAALPTQYTLSAESTNLYCEGSGGVTLMLNSSDDYIEYALYRGGVEYQTWQQGTNGIMRWTNVTSGIYTVKARVISANPEEQCAADMLGQVEVIEKVAPKVAISSVGDVTCPGDETVVKLSFTGEPRLYANILIDGVLQIVQSDNREYVFPYTPRNYTDIKVLQVTDNNCTYEYPEEEQPTLSFDIVNMDDFKIHSSDSHAKICPTQPVTLSINYVANPDDDVEVIWSTNERNVSSIQVAPSVTTTYSVEVHTNNGRCVFEESITVQVAEISDLSITGLEDKFFCSTETDVPIAGMPEGGAFTADYPGFVNGGFLYPNVVTQPGSTTIKLTYEVNNDGCKQKIEETVIVDYVPNDVNWWVTPVAQEPDNKTEYKYCMPDPDQPVKKLTLQGYPIHPNGYFTILSADNTGQGTIPYQVEIVENDKERSLWDIINLSSGEYNIIYTIPVNTQMGCAASSDHKKIIIDPKFQEVIDNDRIYLRNSKGQVTNVLCESDTEATLYADIQAPGKYSLSMPSMLVSQDVNTSIATINPSVVQGHNGTHRAVLTMEDNQGCPHRYSLEFKITSPVNIHSFGLTKQDYCAEDPDEPIIITSERETDGTVSIFRIHDDGTRELKDAVIPKNNPPYFSPTSLGPGMYHIVYTYTDEYKVCEASDSVEVRVHAHPVIDLNLLRDYCRGEKVDLKATPEGGFYETSAREGSLIFTSFNTQTAGLGLHTIKYTVNNEYGCQSVKEMEVQVHGTDNLNIFGLRDEYCSPIDVVTINGFPTDNGDGFFTGPTFLTNSTTQEGYADIDLSGGDFDNSYTVTYHYVETYTEQLTQEEKTCESTLDKKFTILNEAVDFGGIDNNMTICGYETVRYIAANKTENVRFEITPASVSNALHDNGDGTAELYPNLLPEDAVYAITAYYDYIKEGETEVTCSSSRTKSFTVANIAQVSDITLFCDNGENAVRLKDTDTKVDYELTVNGVPMTRLQGTGGDLDFPAITISSAHVQVAGYEAGCKVLMSKELEVKRLEAKLDATDITCFGNSDGKINAIVTGGSVPYHHTFKHVQSGEEFTDGYLRNRPKGEYEYTVTDNIGCQRTASVTIAEPSQLDANVYFDNPKCDGGLTGSVRVEPISGTGRSPYTYAWYDMRNLDQVIATTAEKGDLPDGKYRCVITDNSGCSIYREATINAPDPLTLSLVSKQNIANTGQNQGFIEVKATGGNAPYTFTWTGNSFPQDGGLTIPDVANGVSRQENLLAGNYYITVKDKRGCEDHIAVELTQPSPFVVSPRITHVTCNGQDNGAIRLTISGGEQAYKSMVWTLPDGTTREGQNLDRLKAGIYQFNLVDANDNTFQNNYEVEEPALLEVSALATTKLAVPCYGDEAANIDIVVHGGVAPYAINWPTIPTDKVFEDGLEVRNLGKGNYTVYVKDANGCTVDLTQEVTQPDAPLTLVGAEVKQNTCAGDAKGSIKLEVTGGTGNYTYQWSGVGIVDANKPIEQTDLVSGVYTVTITDATGICSVTEEYTIEQLDPLVIDIKPTHITCKDANNGAIEAIVTGGKPAYEFEWTHVESGAHYQGSMHNGLPVGTYNLQIKDQLSCEAYSSVTLTEPTALQVTTNFTNVTCNGAADGSIAVMATGGTGAYSYSWENVQTGQEIATGVTLLTPLAPVMPGTTDGIYRVKVTDQNGCFVWSDVITITQPEPLSLTYLKQDVAIYGEATGAIEITPAGGSGNYLVEWLSGTSITDANKTATILTNLKADTYLVKVADADAPDCYITLPITITQNQVIEVTVKVTPLTCHGVHNASLEITEVKGGDGNYTYKWTSDNGFESTDKNITGLAPGTYTLVVADGSGAPAFTQSYPILDVTKISITTLDIFSKLGVTCYGYNDAAIRIAIEGGQSPYQITWNNPNMVAQPADPLFAEGLKEGEYQVTVVDALGCEQQYSQHVSGPIAPLAVTANLINNNCYGETNGKIELTVTGGTTEYTYAWTGGLGLVPDAKDQTTLHSGETYRVEVTDANGCKEAQVYTLDALTPIEFDVFKEDVNCHGQKTGKVWATAPTGGTGNFVYRWKNADGSINVSQLELSPIEEGTYTFSVSDDNGCSLEKDITVEQPAHPLTVIIEGDKVLCTGTASGSLYANVPYQEADRNYDYVWYKGDTEHARGTAQLANQGDGDYRVVVTDSKGCSEVAYATVNSSPPMNINIDVTHVEVQGEATGAIKVGLSGGTPEIVYTWTSDNIDINKKHDQNQEGLVADAYELMVTDKYGCKIDTLIYVKQPESMQVNSTVQNIVCYGQTGSIELRVQGGKQPYSAEWIGPDGNPYPSNELNIYNLSPGRYEVTIYDKGRNNSVGPLVYNIAEKTQVEVALLQSSVTTIPCYGQTDKSSIAIAVSGGTEPYHTKWTGNGLDKENVYAVSGLPVGLYKVEVTDRNGCQPTSDLEVEIKENAPIQIDAIVENNTCQGAANGSIQVTATGEGTLTYQWTGMGVVQGMAEQTGLKAGDYSLTVTDGNNCEKDATFTITEPVKNTATLSGNGVICEGEKVTLHIGLTGKAPWTIEYTDGHDIFQAQADERFWQIEVEPTSTCTYKLIKVVDFDGCEAALSGEVPVEVHLIPELTILGKDADCCLGEPAYIDVVFANEGGWTLTYTVDGQIIQDGTFTNAHEQVAITPRVEGTQTYTITRVSNAYCSKEVNETFDITAYRYPSLSVNVDSHICEPDPLNVSLHATGAAPWNVVYYMNGLRYEQPMATEEELITFTAYNAENKFLFESITSGERCKTTLGKEMVSLVDKLPRDAQTIVGATKVCRGSSEVYSTPTIEFADEYVWELPEGYTIASGLGSNQITVDIAMDAKDGEIKVYGKNDCGRTGGEVGLKVLVDSPIAENGVITMLASYACKNAEAVSLQIAENIAGAEYYEWTVPTGFDIVSGQGTRGIVVALNEYAQSGIFTVTPKNHCASAQPIEQELTIRALPLAEAGVDFIAENCATNAQLNANAIDLTANANSWQKWSLISGAGQFADNTSPTSRVNDLLFGENKFRWDVYDGYCANYDVVKVTNNNPGITQPEATDITICEDFITLRAQAPEFGQGRWTLVSGDGEVLTPDGNVTDVIDLSTRTTNVVMWEVYYGNCSNTIPVNITSHSLQELADAGEDGVTTNGVYHLSAQTYNNTSVTGTWTVVSGSGVFEDPHSPITNVTGLAPGYNTLRWTLKGYNCEAYDEIRVRSADEPIAGFNMPSDTGCEPFEVQFDNITIGKADYVWDFGDGAQSTLRSPSHLYDKAGVYKVTLTAIGKYRTDKVEKTVTVLPSPEASFTVSSAQLYVPNAEAHFFNETDKAVSYYWDFGDGHASTEKDPVHTYYEDGEYDITYIVVDENGCADTLKYENYIHVGKGSFIVFPTAFTPNVNQELDGIYSPEERRLDIFYPIWRNVDTYKLEIFNQWGNMVFSTDDVLQGWNGYYLNQPAAQGVYVFKAEGRFRDGTAFREGGSVLLIR